MGFIFQLEEEIENIVKWYLESGVWLNNETSGNTRIIMRRCIEIDDILYAFA